MTVARVPSTLYRKTTLILDAIKFHESLFALPFAYTGMLLAAGGLPTLRQFVLITVAMVSARTVGMAANRIIDRHIDARNARNAVRHLPSGRLKLTDMTALTGVALVVFFLAAWQLNPLALVLAPVAAGYLILYPYTKRFTWAANLLLGWALAIAPSAAWIGVRGSLSWEPVLLSLAVALWAGSFDILYHTQDRDFHRQEGLHSVAERFGIFFAFRLARTLDAMAVIVLLALGMLIGLAWPYYVGLIVAAGMLVYKHRLVSPTDISRLGISFFRINAYVSTSLFVGAALAIFL
ncbi:MAG: UbiA family prenyltransferase [Chloroflexi bacterium]|nr:UbiA family prenyltransferase [Chloroflexota bacterium]